MFYKFAPFQQRCYKGPQMDTSYISIHRKTYSINAYDWTLVKMDSFNMYEIESIHE